MIEINATFLVCMISFILFMMIMNSIFYRPMIEMMRKREGYINKNYDDAKEMSSKADEYTDKYNTGLKNAKEEGKKQSALAIDEAQKQSFEKIREEKNNSKVQIQNKKELLNKDKENLESSINSQVKGNLVSAITTKLLNR